MVVTHKYVFLILFIIIVLESECFYWNQRNQQRIAGRDYMINSEVDRFEDYYYDYIGDEYANVNSGSNREGNSDERTYDTGEIVDFSSFSEAEVTRALSMLTDHELIKLSYLIDSEENRSRKGKRRCQTETCSEEDSDVVPKFVSNIASIKSWFSKIKPEKEKETTTRNILPEILLTTRFTEQTTDDSTTEQPDFLPEDDAQWYGEDRNTMDESGLQEFTNLRRNPEKRKAFNWQEQQEENFGLIDAESISETQGILENSFPKSEQAIFSLRDSLEPLIRVKREESQS